MSSSFEIFLFTFKNYLRKLATGLFHACNTIKFFNKIGIGWQTQLSFLWQHILMHNHLDQPKDKLLIFTFRCASDQTAARLSKDRKKEWTHIQIWQTLQILLPRVLPFCLAQLYNLRRKERYYRKKFQSSMVCSGMNSNGAACISSAHDNLGEIYFLVFPFAQCINILILTCTKPIQTFINIFILVACGQKERMNPKHE